MKIIKTITKFMGLRKTNNMHVVDETDTSNKNSEYPEAIGRQNYALSIWDFPIPSGYCTNPCSDDIDKHVKNDKLGQLLNNPISKCVFYLSDKGYCMFAGNCSMKAPISNEELNEYKRVTNEEIERRYGPRPGGR